MTLAEEAPSPAGRHSPGRLVLRLRSGRPCRRASPPARRVEPARSAEACARLAPRPCCAPAPILFPRLRCYGRFHPFTVSESGSMNQHVPPSGPGEPPSNQIAGHDARILGAKLREIASVVFSPSEAKTLRRFTSGEVARILGVTDSRIRQLSPDLLVSPPEVAPGGRRSSPWRTSTPCAPISTRSTGSAAATGRTAIPPRASTSRSSPASTSRVGLARPRPRPISPSRWCCAATGCSPSTSIPRPASRRCSASGPRTSASPTPPSTTRSATAISGARWPR